MAPRGLRGQSVHPEGNGAGMIVTNSAVSPIRDTADAILAAIEVAEARIRELPRHYPRDRRPARWKSVYRGEPQAELPNWLRYGKRHFLHVKSCRECGSEFETNLGGAKYCSNECRSIHALFATKPVSVTCHVCAGTFWPRKSTADYCSPACRQRAYRQRLAGAKP